MRVGRDIEYINADVMDVGYEPKGELEVARGTKYGSIRLETAMVGDCTAKLPLAVR